MKKTKKLEILEAVYTHTHTRVLKNNGITLVALIITIIILLILVGITITQLVNSSLLSKTKEAKEKVENAMEYENIQMSLLENFIVTSSSTRGGTMSESQLINDFTPSILDYGRYIYIKANVASNNSIYGYIFLVNGNVVGMSTDDECLYTDLEENKNYDVEVIAIDNKGNFKRSSKVEHNVHYKYVARYVIVEVFDHLGSNSAVLNELEIYDKDNSKLNYTILNAFDTVTNSVPAYWNSSLYWYYSNLYDNEISHTSNEDGGQNCTLFLFLSQPNTQNWSRFLIDLGEEKEISNIKIAIGNAESRIPNSVSTYIMPKVKYIEGIGENSTYIKNIKNRNNDNLILTHTETFEQLLTNPTWYNFID